MAGASVNKVILIGNLGQDPELRYTGTGKPVASFTIATSERGSKDGGEGRTEWHSIVVWDRLAEQCSQYLSKGRQVFLEGRLQTRSWEDRSSGQKRYKTEIVAHTVQFLGSARGGDTGGRGGPPPPGDDDYRSRGGGGGGGGGDRSGGGGDRSGGGGGGWERDSSGPSGPPRGSGRQDTPPAAPAATNQEREIPYNDDEDIPF